MPFERTFDGIYGLEPVGQGLGEDGILRGRVRVRPELLGAEDRLHGGVPAAIAEALASLGTGLLTADQGLVPSGLSNDTTVIAAVGVGTTVHAEATPLSSVEGYWVWSVRTARRRGHAVRVQPRDDRRAPAAPLTGGCPVAPVCLRPDRVAPTRPIYRPSRQEVGAMLLAVAIVLLIIAIAGGVIIHPILFVLALVAIAVYFSRRRRV